MQVLEALLQKARNGELAGIALCYRARRGREEAVITGVYAQGDDAATAAMLRLSMRLAQTKGEYGPSP